MLNTPRINLQIDHRHAAYQPGETLTAEYKVEVDSPHDLKSIELSVLWYTMGKGDDDIGVHYFEQLTEEMLQQQILGNWRKFYTVLPNSPLSYAGLLLNIIWCVRVRVFYKNKKDFAEEVTFQLGDVLAPTPTDEKDFVARAKKDSDDSGDPERGL